jgi:hypothetical protein
MLILLIGHCMEAEMDLKAMMESTGGQRWWNLVWLLCAAYVVFQTVQQHYGLGLTRTLPMEVRKIDRSEGGEVYEWRLPHRYRNTLMTHRAVLLEDGWPLQRAERVKDLLESGPGWFNIFRDLTRFLPSDQSDPRSNGRRYEMVVPRQYEGREIWVPWLALLLLSLKVRGGNTFQLSAFSNARIAMLVFVAALLVGGLRMGQVGLYSDGVFNVGGQPESDASAWYHHAQGLAEGWGITTGFSGQRPMYGVLLAPLFWLPGAPMFWIKTLNLLLWATATLGVFLLGRWLQGTLVGLVCAVALLAGETHLPHVLGVLTENPGLGLGVMSLLTLWVAVRRKNLWLIIASGLLTGLTNLASGATMLTLPLVALWLLLAGKRFASWRTAWLWAVTFTLAVSAVLIPWMLRQKMVLGTFSPSLNSGMLLRGGADPVHKRMWHGMMDEPFKKEGILRSDEAGQYEFHMRMFRELVTEDPMRYVKQVLAAWWESFTFLRIDDPGARLAALVLLLSCGLHQAWRSRRILPLVIALGLGLLFLEASRPVAGWCVLAASLVCIAVHWRRASGWLVVLILIHLMMGTLLSAMAGNQTGSRMWQVLDWTAFLMIYAALHSIWRLLSQVSEVTREASIEDTSATESAAAWGWVGYGTFSVLFCLLMMAVGPLAPAQTAVAAEVKQTALDRVKAGHPDVVMRSRQDLNVDVIRLGHRYHLQPAGYDTGHWRSHYRRRGVDRWVLLPERADVKGAPDQRVFMPTQFQGDLTGINAGTTLLLVSARAPQTSGIGEGAYHTAEGLALVPLENDEPQWQQWRWLKPVDLP